MTTDRGARVSSRPQGMHLPLLIMRNPIATLSALTLTSISLLAPQASLAQAVAPMAFDCFDRATNTLVARSAVDITTPAISCLPIPQVGHSQAGPVEPAMAQYYDQAPASAPGPLPAGPSMGQMILEAAAQQGFSRLFGTFNRGDRISNVTTVHNGNRCEGMASICGHGNGMGDVASGNAHNSGNHTNSGNSSTRQNSQPTLNSSTLDKIRNTKINPNTPKTDGNASPSTHPALLGRKPITGTTLKPSITAQHQLNQNMTAQPLQNNKKINAALGQ